MSNIKSGHTVHSHILYNIVEISTIPEIRYLSWGFCKFFASGSYHATWKVTFRGKS